MPLAPARLTWVLVLVAAGPAAAQEPQPAGEKSGGASTAPARPPAKATTRVTPGKGAPGAEAPVAGAAGARPKDTAEAPESAEATVAADAAEATDDAAPDAATEDEPPGGKPESSGRPLGLELRLEGPTRWLWFDLTQEDFRADLDLGVAYRVVPWLSAGLTVGLEVAGAETTLVGVPLRVFAKLQHALGETVAVFAEPAVGVSFGSTRLASDLLLLAGVSGGVEVRVTESWAFAAGPRLDVFTDLEQLSLPLGAMARLACFY